ncbi:MAG: hypothetical protein DYG94_14780 [Leptolyngbya sp. PLA3]|nr:MAG: hypothetical protein EDM82_15120 [Cyanobacteria bacterium CYA]MCE7969994.1 hypothetical protein [Leptolyngbya sp. PL-A3]
MSNARRIVVLASAAALVAGAVALAPHHQSEKPARIRLGVYDSRGVAIAWAGSDFNTIGGKMKELEAAKAAGNQDEVKRLEEWGMMQQRLFHFQGFGRYPVDDYVAALADQLPQLLKDRDLAAIVWLPAAAADDVETVDVTVDLMKLFGMDETKARKMMNEVSTHEPLEFAELYNMDPRD